MVTAVVHPAEPTWDHWNLHSGQRSERWKQLRRKKTPFCCSRFTEETQRAWTLWDTVERWTATTGRRNTHTQSHTTAQTPVVKHARYLHVRDWDQDQDQVLFRSPLGTSVSLKSAAAFISFLQLILEASAHFFLRL